MKEIKPVRISGPTIKALSLFIERSPTPLSGADFVNEKRILSGTLYPLLDRLETAGWLESNWENVDPAEVGRPRKRLYRLTANGEKAARSVLLEHGIQTTKPNSKGNSGADPGWAPA